VPFGCIELLEGWDERKQGLGEELEREQGFGEEAGHKEPPVAGHKQQMEPVEAEDVGR
jgi:hypothetical protein